MTALGRLGGRTVGVVANNPLRLGGCLDSTSAEKASRFVRMCDAFGVPLVVLVDVPGYLPGVGQEWDGVVRRGAKLLHAFAECVVPRVTLVTRKTYGGAYIAMNARAARRHPRVRLARRGGRGDGGRGGRPHPAPAQARRGRRDLRPACEAELAAEHERIAGGVEKAIEIGVVDEVVEPTVTRSAIARAIDDAVHRGAARSARQHPALHAIVARPQRDARDRHVARRVSDDLVQPADRARPRRRGGTSRARRPTRLPSSLSISSTSVVSPSAAFTTAALSRSSGIRMSPCRPVTAWKTPRSGVNE